MLLVIAGSRREVVAGVVVHRLMREGRTSRSVSGRFILGDLLDLLDRLDDGVANHPGSEQGLVFRSSNVATAGIMAGATRTGVVSMVMMMVMVLVVPDFVTAVVQLVEVVLVGFLHVRVLNYVEVFSNVVAWLVLTTYRVVAMEIVIAFAVVVIVVVHVISLLVVMVAMVPSTDVIIIDVVVFVCDLHLCLLL